jgi:hypothetical protein
LFANETIENGTVVSNKRKVHHSKQKLNERPKNIFLSENFPVYLRLLIKFLEKQSYLLSLIAMMVNI